MNRSLGVEQSSSRFGRRMLYCPTQTRNSSTAIRKPADSHGVYGKGGSKEKRLTWLNFINEKCKIVAHASSAVSLSVEDLSQLEQYEDWMIGQFLDNNSREDAKSVSVGSS
jgi:hypothetical protein